MTKKQIKRQSIRRALILVSFLLFPIIINYFSPYIIIDGASQGIVNGSLIVFGAMFFSALVVGRAWCGWLCPMAGLQEACFVIRNKSAAGGRWNWIKWGIWIPWIGIITAATISAGGYHKVDFFHLTESGISVDAPDIVFRYLTYYIVLGTVVILSLTAGRRAFCHYGCWMAPFMILGRKLRNLGRWPTLRLRANPSLCKDCQTCSTNCPMSLDVHGMVQQGKMEHAECILCGTCVDGCPKKAISFSFSSGL